MSPKLSRFIVDLIDCVVIKLFKMNHLISLLYTTVQFTTISEFKLTSVLLVSRFNNFLIRYKNCDKYLCNLIAKLIAY